ncbi:DNAH5 [Cordylochernes scorpioides]|uniref:DNAH5 n=1 Tax=Cordylochernes scorpioides TaxID=51811 RepID=A0ABY6L572_9ARAC|nr:DNAH5 [Cordylochernes scorpioides]
MGHYCSKRGFSAEIQELVRHLVPLTRKLWQVTKVSMLPTPAKFHYIFNLRDLSRVWQGLVSAQSNIIRSEDLLLALWKHECCRVIADRFTSRKDYQWFENTIMKLIKENLGEAYLPAITTKCYFVDFLRDVPEGPGEEEDGETETPKVYEPVYSMSVLVERLSGLVTLYNEMMRGVGLDLVFFEDATVHLIKISRIIRTPSGNALLVGVGGSGKQSLTKLASFIAGYKTFQITLTRSYNVGNLLEDLKVLYRTTGIQDKGTTFIFTDQDVKEECFLEYLNNVLASGIVSNLFNKDEQLEVIQELMPFMKREMPRKPPTPENVMEFFLTRTRKNLHVVLCFSPVGEKFRARALKFPGLISGCTVDWFQAWPRDALVAVSTSFLQAYSLDCSEETKEQLVKAMGGFHDIVATYCSIYYQRYKEETSSYDVVPRFRRSTHVTPKSYLTFITGYKTVYRHRQREIGELARRMENGLAKLEEASVSVERLKLSLAAMEKDLALASEKAEKVLLEVTQRAREAEAVKDTVQRAKDKAQILVNDISGDKAVAEEKLEAARPALEEAEAALNTIKPAHIATVRKLGRPPHLIMRVMDCVMLLFQRRLKPFHYDFERRCVTPSWDDSLKFMSSSGFLQALQNFFKDTITDEVVELLEPYFRMDDYDMDTAKRVCGDVAGLLSWTKAMVAFFGINKEVLPLKANLAIQEARLSVANNELAKVQSELEEKEQELLGVQMQYENAMSEKQKLQDQAAVCRRKMSRASMLITELGGEYHRWTEQSKQFKQQLVRYNRRWCAGVVGMGHYCSKRGFSAEIQELVRHLVPLTRKLWQVTKVSMLPTPAKFHYIFNLRDLSRVWQGLVSAQSNIIRSEDLLLALWKHECCRVIADRFTSRKDYQWFENTIMKLIKENLGEAYLPAITTKCYFVDFLRDVPEGPGEEEDGETETPKVYEPVYSMSVLVERLSGLVTLYNEMMRGVGLDLVFFEDATVHLIKISRIIRTPSGNALLVGVGGSGKQSLTKLASFIAGYKTFQITLTRSYNVGNLLEDLKVLYRTTGIQDKGTTFIFTDQDVKEECFLEYLNNVLASGIVSNLFNKDEQLEVIQELMPFMKREMPRKPPTPENVMEFFLTRTRKNLHVVLCFSPVGEKFRARALKFPGLISGCTVDWFQAWPRDALVAVSTSFLQAYSLDCSEETKEQLVKAMGGFHDIVATYCSIYYQRFRRSTHVTPKSYLTFITGYKTVYRHRQREIGELARRMENGLAKLEEASVSVERLKLSLAAMEKDLALASEKAEKVLLEVTQRAREAEAVKDTVQRAKDKAQILVNDISGDKAVAEEKLEAARPALEEAEAALNTIKPAHIATVRKLGRPPHLIMRVMDCVMLLFQRRLKPFHYDFERRCVTPSWDDSLKVLFSLAT